ncbi:lactate utilization protein [Dethiobacter alkaliphilus]|uniref:lactate utilization protein n=1 Tax=Dethiobacter alkaliphilus TaxID=427926 RepID=UPI002227CBE2|nr:lactate utilization protein [Dethiobacter alkaliphilus]MCW3490215.1 lactate utilization protein [Dethiobacter alkaliphilus]
MEESIKEVLQALTKRGIPCSYAADKAHALGELAGLIAKGCSVGIGGSMTVQGLGVESVLEERGCRVFWHWRVNQEDVQETLRQAMLADVYLSSTNAIILDGRLVNVDGRGNRVASMIFGPEKVVIIAGKNKIVNDFEAALDRIKKVACPQNARRLQLETPCAETDNCTDCASAERMCNVTTIIEGNPNGIEMHVLLVGEDLGF